MNKIAILLAVYNGEKYIKEQLDSIVNQSFTNWKLFIRDDGSTDKSVTIINEYISQYPSKIQLINDGLNNLGSCNNFFKLLEYAENSEFYMFADQDDVWNKNKIEISLNAILKIEISEKFKKPILLHTDLEVVDINLNQISPSFWKYQQMEVNNSGNYNKLLIQNIVTGCTVIFNYKLREKMRILPNNVFIHDWWIALVASVFGRIDFIEDKTLKYRQHNKNVEGAKKSGNIHFLKRLFKLHEVEIGLKKSVFQANVFLEIYKDKLTYEQVACFTEFSNLFIYNYLKRRLILIKYGILKSNIKRNIGLFLAA
jgi:glycosyltransferase involved in cell wall biosynthesis